jgi:DNA-binding CsgD family transcriptional regulator
MRLTAQDENDLLTALYDGPFEQPLWTTFLDRLRARVRASYAGLIFRPPHQPINRPIEIFSGARSPPELQRLYEKEIYKRDPLPYFSLREGRVYGLSDLLDQNDPMHRAFFEDLLAPSGMNHMRMIRVSEPGGTNAWLSFARANQEFAAADGALLSALAPHLSRALRSYVALERERFRANVAADAVQRMNFGWLSLDAGGRVLEASSHAERLLRHCAELRKDRHGRLTAMRPSLDRELTQAVKACAGSAAARLRALQVSRDPWIDLLLVPVPDRRESAAPAPVVIAYLQGDSRSTAECHEQIAELFGLLPSEARLALALSRGLTIAEAAADLGLTIETARNYSKKIYAKMGARGQADLIRFILASVLALA